MRQLKAVLQDIPAGFGWFRHQEIDLEKVRSLRAHLRQGGDIPPPVLAKYGDGYMPLDGHHRTMASDLEGLPLRAWVVSGRSFETLDRQTDRGVNHVICGGVPTFQVAADWDAAQ